MPVTASWKNQLFKDNIQCQELEKDNNLQNRYPPEWHINPNPPLIVCHPIFAVGRDDDIGCTKKIVNDILLKVQGDTLQDKIIFAPDFKVCDNLLKLKEEDIKYHCIIPECPVLHAGTSKITNLMSVYGSAGVKALAKDNERPRRRTRL